MSVSLTCRTSDAGPDLLKPAHHEDRARERRSWQLVPTSGAPCVSGSHSLWPLLSSTSSPSLLSPGSGLPPAESRPSFPSQSARPRRAPAAGLRSCGASPAHPPRHGGRGGRRRPAGLPVDAGEREVGWPSSRPDRQWSQRMSLYRSCSLCTPAAPLVWLAVADCDMVPHHTLVLSRSLAS